MNWRITAAPILTLLLAAGCAEERPPINRVQPNALDKGFFVGALDDVSDDPDFLFRDYVVDGSVSQTAVTVGTGSNVERIRWEITEDLLLARRAYQSSGGDDKGKPGKIADGTILAAYAIDAHFDIRREYNPSTGEEYNVIVENSSDRPWDQRQYMRVDWSKNLVDSPRWLGTFLGGLFGNLEVTPVEYHVNNPDDPDAPHFEPDDGYFDVTSRFTVEPAASSLFGGLPACVVTGLFTGSSTYECDPQEAVVRSSFKRIDAESDFEPLEMSRAPADIVGNPVQLNGSLLVGYSNTVDQGWDPGYGYTDALYSRYAHLHNIWQASHIDHACTDDVDANGDGTADQCHPELTGYTGNLGSQCDVVSQLCTIPYRDRKIRTVTYHVNDAMPAELLDPVDESGQPTAMGPSEEVMDGWNRLLKVSVATAREVECRRTGGDRDACHSAYFDGDEMLPYGGWLIPKVASDEPVLTLCHNPVRVYDHENCGPAGYRARMGDIRHNFLSYWPHEARARYGGIGNWGADPLSGEIHGAAGMVMGRSATRAAALQRDIIQLVLGDLTMDDIMEGVPAERYVEQLQNPEAPQALDESTIAARVASIDADHAVSSIMPVSLAVDQPADAMSALIALDKATSPDVDRLTGAQHELAAVASALEDSLYEAQLIDGQWLTATAGLDPKGGDAELDHVSPLRAMDPGTLALARAAVKEHLHARGYCFGHDESPILGSQALQGLARYFGAKYPADSYTVEERGALIYDELWKEAYKGIAVHEVGHSLGLLHNFASSWDAPNYHPAYWQLRTHEGASTESCNGQPRTGDTSSVANDTCMGPRYLDPHTDDELGIGEESHPAIEFYANTSVMEYQIERFGETVGLGQYDAHAMKSLYGRVLETFEDEDRGGLSLSQQETLMPRLESQLGDIDLVTRSTPPFQNQTFAKPTHYTETARLMKVFDAARCRDATPEEQATAKWRIVHGKVCAPAPRDHAAWKDFEHGQARPGIEGSETPFLRARTPAATGSGDVRWFYRYGATFNAYLHTQFSDSGADIYEVTKNATAKFETSYPFLYFRRQNREFLSEALPAHAAGGFYSQLRAYHHIAAGRVSWLKSFGDPIYQEAANSDHWLRPVLLAETEMFDALARSILMPEPGSYAEWAGTPVDATRPIYDLAGPGQNSTFELGAVDARFIGQSFDSSPEGGGSWTYLEWMEHAGFGVEKIFATMALTDARPVLATISRDNYLDGRNSRVSFRADMPHAVDRLLGGILAEDWSNVGMHVRASEGALPKPTLPSLTASEVPARPNDAHVLFPNVGYRQQLGMLIFAHVYARTSQDQTLANKLRIWVDGQQGEIDIPESQQIRYYDPVSGYTYVSRRYGLEPGDSTMVDRGIGSRMVSHANALMAAAYEVETDPETGDMLVDEFGTPILVVDGEGYPIERDDPAAHGELARYVGLMDAARQISAIVGFGPL